MVGWLRALGWLGRWLQPRMAEGMGAARIGLEVAVLVWVLDWVEGAAVGGTAVAGGEMVLVVLVSVRVVRESE